MKKLLVGFAVLMLMLTGCGANVPADLVGEWDCRALASDNETDTSFYHLRIESDGEFSMYDIAAGNPGIAGKLTSDEEGKLSLKCTAEDFDPPFCWDISETVTLDYKAEGNVISLGYDDIWLTFDKSEE